MSYEPIYVKPYPNGWKNKPDKTTPVTGAILNNYDTMYQRLETYLAGNPIIAYQVSELPEASDAELGNVYQYLGTTGSGLEKGYFYICVSSTETVDEEEVTTYSWTQINVQPGGSVSANDVSYDNTTSGLTADNVQDAIDEVFQSVSDGKELIADAITDKGVQTSANDSFATMATNISNIQSGEAELAFNVNNSTSTVANEEYSHTVVSSGKLYLGLMSYIYQREAKLYKNDVEVTPTTDINTVPTSNQQKLYSKTYNGITVESGDVLKVTWTSASNYSKHLLAFGVIV